MQPFYHYDINLEKIKRFHSFLDNKMTTFNEESLRNISSRESMLAKSLKDILGTTTIFARTFNAFSKLIVAQLRSK
jgi:hypothetical protein